MKRILFFVACMALFFSLAGTASGAQIPIVPLGSWQAWPKSQPQAAQRITIINDAGVSHRTIKRLERALRIQANRDVRPIWHTPRVVFGRGGWKFILTNAPQLDGLGGFHASSATVAPFATVYIKANGDSWTILASHEFVEMLVDPYNNGDEVCDPIGNVYYNVRGVQVSDFVTPAYFSGLRPDRSWDFEGFFGVLSFSN